MAEMAEESAVPDVDLDAVNAAVEAAIASGDETGLRVLGYGEISLVVGWPTESPVAACKRLPAFTSPAAAATYRSHYDAYLDVLADRGVEVVPSRFATVSGSPRSDGSVPTIAYVVQPVVDPASLGPEVLRGSEADPEHPLLTAVVDAVSAVTDARTGVDAQISNWVYEGSSVRYLDITTPMLFDADGTPLMDVGIFLASFPWFLRAAVGRFVVPGVVGSYRDPRKALVDLAANLLKERLENWIPAVLEAANRHVSPVIERAEVDKYYRSDARLWAVMLRLRRADRAWQRNVRRRPYPFLLPGPIER